jgi:hypothetical protein
VIRSDNPTMCTRQENGSPVINTAIPYWDRGPQIGSRKRASRTAPVVVISIDEVERKRRELDPDGQSSLHLACQKNSSLDTLEVLASSCKSVLSQLDDGGNTPLMIGK